MGGTPDILKVGGGGWGEGYARYKNQIEVMADICRNNNNISIAYSTTILAA
jgi:hypothetical protein